MKIERFGDIEAWQLARELTRIVYALTKKEEFAKDFGLKGQIQDADGSSMHNIAEGFDSETDLEFIRFLRYSKRSCTQVQSELYVALDQEYITNAEFQDVYGHAGRTRAAVHGFIRYLTASVNGSKAQGRKSRSPGQDCKAQRTRMAAHRGTY
jgi:four helix bundle protein